MPFASSRCLRRAHRLKFLMAVRSSWFLVLVVIVRFLVVGRGREVPPLLVQAGFERLQGAKKRFFLKKDNASGPVTVGCFTSLSSSTYKGSVPATLGRKFHKKSLPF